MWRSILSAKDAVKQGCRRRIGDGASTKVWNVPWLPCEANGCITTELIHELRDIDVQNLMDINKGAWDDDVLDDLFNDRDRQLIRRIPIPGRSRSDSWFWMLDNKGQFTVRSVYKQLQGSFDM